MVQLVTINIDKSKFKGLDDNTIEQIETGAMKNVSKDLIRNLQTNSPVDTGHLRKWFMKGGFSPSNVEIVSPAIYGVFVNDGTGLYGPKGQIIRPKNGQAMVFKPGKKWKGPVGKNGKWKGYVGLRYSRGQKGQKFVEKSIEQTEARLGSLFLSALRDVFK